MVYGKGVNQIMAKYFFSKSEIKAAAMEAMLPARVLVDIGCGIVPQTYVKSLVHVCCEPFLEYVSLLRSNLNPIKNTVYIIEQMTWRDVVEHFPEKSVDTVILVDVIEHLEKEEGADLLRKTENIARNQVIIHTPLGFLPQYHPDGKDIWGLNGGAWQEHKSGWLPEDFEGDGWNFYICNEYHFTDNMGNALEKPFGVFWAIKNCKQHSNSGRGSGYKKMAYLMQRKIISILMKNIYQ